MNKFKVWDVMKQKFLPQDSVSLRGDGQLFVDGQAVSMENYQLFFSTGIKDVADVELYAGDIIKDGPVVALIEWDRSSARFYTITPTQRAWANCRKIGTSSEDPKMVKR